MLNQILRPVARRALQQGARSAHGEGHHSTFKYVTMDEACVPQGSWKENYNKQQTKFNTHLIVGVVSFVATCAAIGQFELIFFNYKPPTPKE